MAHAAKRIRIAYSSGAQIRDTSQWDTYYICFMLYGG